MPLINTFFSTRSVPVISSDEQISQKQRKLQLTWAKAPLPAAQAPVKTLAEIQKEEALKLEKQKELTEKKAGQPRVVNNCGIWNNAASQLTWRGGSMYYE